MQFRRSLAFVTLLRCSALVTIGATIASHVALAAEPTNNVGQFQAGAATSNITPPLGLEVVGGWSPTPAIYVHDELHARCLVLDDGATRLAIVLCDNVGIGRPVIDHAKQRLEKEANLPPSHVLVASTHSHSAVSANPGNRLIPNKKLNDYQQFLAGRIVDGVKRAIVQLQPARIAWGSASEPSELFNRRWYMTPGPHLANPFGGVDQVRMNPPSGPHLLEPAGPTDPEVSFISVQSTQGTPIALLANYSLHYVGGVGDGHISADYFAVFAKLIADKLSAGDAEPAFVGIMSNGTSGDVNNIDFRNRGRRYEPYEKMKVVAEKVATKVAEAHQSVEWHDYVTLDGAAEDLTLDVRKPTPEVLAYVKKVLAQDPNTPEGPAHERQYAGRVMAQLDAGATVDVPLQVLRIGSLGIAAIPFEVFTETGLQIKQDGPLEKTFTIELANGSFGYLPTPRQHRLGGYETWLGTNMVEIEASDKIVAKLMELFADVSPRDPK